MMKVIVAHPGQQHSYKTAVGLKEFNQLYKYITTVYMKKKSITNMISRFLPDNLKIRAINRKCNELDDHEIVQFCELEGLILLFLQRVDKNKKLYDKWAQHITKKFGVKVAEYAIKNNADAIIIYETQGAYIGKYLRKHKSKIKLIMDVSAANLDYMKEIYSKDFKICPSFKNRLLFERGYLWNDKVMKPLREEIIYPDAFLVGSSFVKKSLIFANVDEDKIYVCPYGSNFSSIEKKKFGVEKPLKLVYVGNVAAMKGIYYLLEAVMQFNKNDVELTLVGSYDNSDNTFDKYLKRVSFIGAVPHFEVKKYLENADVFVMPSLGEGFNLSTVEALSLGLPCIVSNNSGINDFIVEEENGLTFNIQDIENISKCIQWFLNNKSKLPSMSKKSLETANVLTWNNYNKRLSKIVTEVVLK